MVHILARNITALFLLSLICESPAIADATSFTAAKQGTLAALFAKASPANFTKSQKKVEYLCNVFPIEQNTQNPPDVKLFIISLKNLIDSSDTIAERKLVLNPNESEITPLTTPTIAYGTRHVVPVSKDKDVTLRFPYGDAPPVDKHIVIRATTNFLIVEESHTDQWRFYKKPGAPKSLLFSDSVVDAYKACYSVAHLKDFFAQENYHADAFADTIEVAQRLNVVLANPFLDKNKSAAYINFAADWLVADRSDSLAKRHYAEWLSEFGNFNLKQ